VLHYWEVWYPKAAATGLLFARGRCDPTDRMIVHSPAEVLSVEVYGDDRQLIARGKDLPRTQQSPMCLLRIDGDRVTREDMWPTDADAGTFVLLPGGEICILEKWWNAEDRKEWRWSAEFYNSIRE
jgi:hypothetical protein